MQANTYEWRMAAMGCLGYLALTACLGEPAVGGDCAEGQVWWDDACRTLCVGSDVCEDNEYCGADGVCLPSPACGSGCGSDQRCTATGCVPRGGSGAILVSPTSGLTTTEAGGTATFSIVLSTAPTANVVINLSSSDTTEGTVNPTPATFSPTNWAQAQTITVTGVDDDQQDGDQSYTIILAPATSVDLNYDGLDPADVSVTNVDNDGAGFTIFPLSGLEVSESGTSDTFTVRLNTAPTATVSIGLSSSDPGEGTVSPTSLSFTTANWSSDQTVTVTGVSDALEDGDQSFQIITSPATSADPAYNGINPPDVSAVTHDDTLPTPGFEISPTTIALTESWQPTTFTIRLRTQPTANVNVDLASNNNALCSVSPVLATFTTADWNTVKTITVTPALNGVVEIDTSVTIVTSPAVSADASYNGLNPPDVSITNIDGDLIERVSVNSSEAQVNGASYSYATGVSADGRYVAFASDATDLVAGDSNNAFDAFRRDRQLGTTIRVSLSSAGAQLTPVFWGVSSIAISGNGRCVAFTTDANGVAPGDDTDGNTDLFLRDVTSNTTELVNVSSAEVKGNSNDALFVSPGLSNDCRYVVFSSSATNLVANDTNAVMDIFVRDRQLGTTERVSVTHTGGQADGASNFGSISADGRYVTFTSAATNLVTNDTNGVADVFIRDRQSATTTRVSLSNTGTEGNAATGLMQQISAAGGHVMFMSLASNLTATTDDNSAHDVFVRNLTAVTTQPVSLNTAGVIGNDISSGSGLDTSGRYVVFVSSATNLVSNDTNAKSDVFVRDLTAGTTIRASVSGTDAQANGLSNSAAISANGRVIVFSSEATNLISGDTNAKADVFLIRRR